MEGSPPQKLADDPFGFQKTFWLSNVRVIDEVFDKAAEQKLDTLFDESRYEALVTKIVEWFRNRNRKTASPGRI